MESFGQLVIQGILLMRFEWLVRKDDFNSFGVTFQIFVTASMGISFLTMTKAVMAYHNRSREALRPTFSLGGIFTVLMFTLMIVTKVGVYIFGFQNMPGLFVVPVVIKIGVGWFLFTIFDPAFPSMLAHDKIIYLLVSFLVPISVPSKNKKRMLKNYGISLFLFYAECTFIIFTAVMIKNHYHFDLFRNFYKRLPQLLHLGPITFETMAFFLLVICFVSAMLATLLICLATTYFHPVTSLFKPKPTEVVQTKSTDFNANSENKSEKPITLEPNDV